MIRRRFWRPTIRQRPGVRPRSWWAPCRSWTMRPAPRRRSERRDRQQVTTLRPDLRDLVGGADQLACAIREDLEREVKTAQGAGPCVFDFRFLYAGSSHLP